jgi:hypothetical protein
MPIGGAKGGKLALTATSAEYRRSKNSQAFWLHCQSSTLAVSYPFKRTEFNWSAQQSSPLPEKKRGRFAPSDRSRTLAGCKGRALPCDLRG